MTDDLREKYIQKFISGYVGKCPVCLEQGKTRVLPFGDDFWFCENPNCKVTRHTNLGYYIMTDDSIQAPNVTFLKTSMVQKRE